MSATLVARDLSMSFGARVVLDQVAITVAPPDRIGVVGPNGCGKTTLLRVLAGLVEPDDGTVTVSPRDATVGYLAQEIERRPGELTVDALARVTGIADASQELDRATAALAANKPDAADDYDVALQRWLRLGAADFPTRAEVTCGEVGLPVAALAQPLEQLSGGQAARVALAGVRLARFDIVLLDEPTNDLDFDGLDRLEQRRVGRELRARLLELTDDDARPEVAGSGGERQLPEQRVEQGRLPAAVATEDRQALGPVDRQVDRSEAERSAFDDRAIEASNEFAAA